MVGGAVRDAILGQTPKDLDLATDATPAEIAAILPDLIVKHSGAQNYVDNGVTLVKVNGVQYELATFRPLTMCMAMRLTVAMQTTICGGKE